MVPGRHRLDRYHERRARDGRRQGRRIDVQRSNRSSRARRRCNRNRVDWIWIDERCSEEIYSELVARTTATDGILFLSYTPLKGGGELTYRFLNEYSPDRIDIRIDAQDAKHISAGAPRAARGKLSAARARGPHSRHPAAGHRARVSVPARKPDAATSIPTRTFRAGRSGSSELTSATATRSPRRFARGCRRSTNFYVVDGFKMERGEALYHVKRIAGDVPRAAHPDRLAARRPNAREGQRRRAGRSVPRARVRPMLPTHAENKGGGYHTEPAIEEMCGYMKRGAFSVASHLSEWAEEFLSYHRNEDYKIVRLRDDLISATRYAFMMRHEGQDARRAARPTAARLASTAPNIIRDGFGQIAVTPVSNSPAARRTILTDRLMCGRGAKCVP